MSNTAAGWYPQEDGRQRYWDGERWTEHFAPGVGDTGVTAPNALQSQFGAAPGHSVGPGSPGAVQGVSSRPWFKKKRIVIPAGLAAFVIMVNALSGGGDTEADVAAANTSTSTPSVSVSAESLVASQKPSASTAAPAAPAAPAATKAAAPAPPTQAPAPRTPALTAAQRNAVRSAESYLEMSGFSQEGLIEQLEFEGYSAKDAKAALSTLTIDWNDEAAQSAKAYTEMTGFSRSGLIEQLEFEGYTKAQAKFGADSVGL